MPQPTAVMMLRTSSLPRTLSSRARSTLRILPRSGRMAWYIRSRPPSAVPPAESPSTRNSSLASWSRVVQSMSLPGRPPPERTPLRLRTSSRALRAASRASAASIAFCDDLLGRGRVLFEELAELVVDDLGDDPLDLAVAQLGLGLPLELRVGHADADDRGEPFLEVLAGDRQVLLVLGDVGPGVVVEGPGQGGAEAGQVGAALDGVDVVAVADDVLADRVVVLDGDLDLDVLLVVAAEQDDRRVQGRLGAVEVLDELGQALRGEELAALLGRRARRRA